MCELFCNKDHSYMPIVHIVKHGGFRACLEFVSNLGEDFKDDFLDVLVFDAIILNTDRHYGNFGFLIDKKTNKIIKMAPIFDNGASLLCYGMDTDELKDYNSMIKYSSTKGAVRYDDFILIAKKYMTKSQIDKIKKLRHPRYNLSYKRVELLERLIQNRIEILLN